jgi:hypothetical protein
MVTSSCRKCRGAKIRSWRHFSLIGRNGLNKFVLVLNEMVLLGEITEKIIGCVLEIINA